jgi:ribose transport system permease protein
MDDKRDAVRAEGEPAGAAGSASRAEPRRGRFRLPAETGPLLGLIGVFAFFLIVLVIRHRVGSFVRMDNLQLLMNQNSIRLVVVLGMLFVIVNGGIDLSVGSVVALAAAAAVLTYKGVMSRTGSPDLAGFAAVGAAVGAGGLCGAANGLTISGLRLSPFVATLGMMSVARGVTCWLLGDKNVTLRHTPAWVDALQESGSSVLFFDPGVWSALLLAVAAALVLRFTVFGRHCYAIGSNEATARLCGVNVGVNKVAVYTLAGLLAGWAGVLAFAQSSGGAAPDMQVGLELEVIAAAVIGGASLRGGQGSVLGVVLGVLIWGVLENGVTYCGVPQEVKYILSGVIVVANTAVSQWRRKRAA